MLSPFCKIINATVCFNRLLVLKGSVFVYPRLMCWLFWPNAVSVRVTLLSNNISKLLYCIVWLSISSVANCMLIEYLRSKPKHVGLFFTFWMTMLCLVAAMIFYLRALLPCLKIKDKAMTVLLLKLFYQHRNILIVLSTFVSHKPWTSREASVMDQLQDLTPDQENNLLECCLGSLTGCLSSSPHLESMRLVNSALKVQT